MADHDNRNDGGTVRNLGFSCPSPLLLALAAATIAVSIGIMALAGHWKPRLIVEGLWCLALLGLFSALRSVRVMCSGLSRLQRFVLLSFGLAMLVGQFLGGGRHTYPFVRWAMFTDPQSEAKAVIYEGISKSGKRELLRPPEIVLSLGSGRFVSKLKYARKSSEAGTRPRGKTEFDQILKSLTAIFNASPQVAPVVAIEVFEYTVPTNSYLDRSQYRKQLVWRTEN